MINVRFQHRSSRPANSLPEEPRYVTSSLVSWRVALRTSGVWSPPTDVYETEDRFIVRMEIAGMEEENFNVRLEQNRLIISGVRQDTPEQRAFHQMEIHFGEFSTEIDLPVTINNDMVEAEYHQGFLRVTLPKLQPKNLSISS